jgi:hypothetical protein
MADSIFEGEVKLKTTRAQRGQCRETGLGWFRVNDLLDDIETLLGRLEEVERSLGEAQAGWRAENARVAAADAKIAGLEAVVEGARAACKGVLSALSYGDGAAMADHLRALDAALGLGGVR